jgi:Ca-activated chloride channel family protein
MTFAAPLLLLTTLLPLVLLGYELLRLRRDRETAPARILGGSAAHGVVRLSRSTPAASPRRLLVCLGLILVGVAAARPQWGRIEEPVFDQSREILIAVDLSRSMLAPDVKPTRLDRAKLLIQSLLERLAGERVGLLVFSGTAFLQSPLSSDYEILREFLPELQPNFLPAGGTNYEALLTAALEAFSRDGGADRYLIILSDGEAADEAWRPLADQLKSRGIRVLALGIGTRDGAMIPEGDGSLVKDERGAVVLSRLEPATLQSLAATTDGRYADASGWVDLAELLRQTVEAGRRGEFKEVNRVRLAERFQFFLAPAVLLLLAGLWREFPVRPTPRPVTLKSASS